MSGNVRVPLTPCPPPTSCGQGWHAFNYTLYVKGLRPLPLCGVGRYVVVVWPAGVRVFVLLPSFWQCARLVVGSARKGRLLLQHVLLGYSYRVLLQSRVLPQHRVCLQRYHRQATTKRSQLSACLVEHEQHSSVVRIPRDCLATLVVNARAWRGGWGGVRVRLRIYRDIMQTQAHTHTHIHIHTHTHTHTCMRPDRTTGRRGSGAEPAAGFAASAAGFPVYSNNGAICQYACVIRM